MDASMTSSELSQARKDLRETASAEDAAGCQRFFKTGPGEYGEGDRFLGVRVPQTRKVARRYNQLKEKACLDLLQSEFHEERLLALLILTHQFERGDAENRKRIYTLYLQNTCWINNWDLVDTSAPQIVGGYLIDRSREPLYDLVASDLLWERRIAIMATFPFIRAEDFADTLRLSRQLLQDHEDLIHKAVGWMLREVGNRDQEAEERFLKTHCREMPRTMLRYAIEKFPKEKRKSYLAGTVS